MVEALAVRALEQLQALLVVADQLGGQGEEVEVVEFQRRRAVGRGEVLVRVAPALLSKRFPTEVERTVDHLRAPTGGSAENLTA